MNRRLGRFTFKPQIMNKRFYPIAIALLLGSWHTVLNAQIEILNDEFSESSTLVNWQNINQTEGWNITQLESYNIGDSVSDHLFMRPLTEAWYAEYRGAYLFKEIAGDFVLSTKVNNTGRDGVSLPSSSFSLAGIMIRTPVEYSTNDPENEWQAGEQNYIFMSIGQATGANFDFEIKNTCNSVSCLSIVDIDTNHISEIRMIRHGDEIIVMSRFEGDDWIIRNRFHRNGIQMGNNGVCGNLCSALFPDTVQIGFVAYTDWPKVSSLTTSFHNNNTIHPDSLGMNDPTPGVAFNPDVRASFDYARFDSLYLSEAQDSLDFSDIQEVSDSLVLDLFGFDSGIYCPKEIHVDYEGISDKTLLVRSDSLVTSNAIFTQSELIKLYSRQVIDLEIGFEIPIGTVLEVQIADCPNDE